ncbi:MAG: hypothetical protein AB4911_02010 [Oscillochloridaceae bacterium umkhey_bin13]
MGHSHWSDHAYASRQDDRRASGRSAFSYNDHVHATGQLAVHPQMNLFGKIRESRDSAEHPDSLAIAVIFDVTGSMGNVPRILQAKLGALMRVLIVKGYVAHPQILFGAVGDAYCDQVPLQIGQFESGLEMDDDLGKIVLEGGGGGQVFESYELGFYVMARHTSIDCFERRRRKGYLFTIGDEKPYAAVRARQVRDLLGDPLERDIATAQIIAEAEARYECFHIIPTNTSHGRDPAIQQHWRELLGERVLLLEDEAAVCETIALAIGLCEGALDNLNSGADDLADAGASRAATAAAAAALTPYARRRQRALLPG